MNIIDEMREFAKRYTVTAREMEFTITDWADRLERATILVAVPQGEACRVLRTNIGSVFQHLGKVYRNIGGEIRGDASEINARELMDGSKHIFDGDTIVQPVALVPITEAEV